MPNPTTAAHSMRQRLDTAPLSRFATVEEEMRELIRRACEVFTDRTRLRNIRILETRYGVGRAQPTTLKDAVEPFGLTRERARQLEARAVEAFGILQSHVRAPVIESTAQAVAARSGLPSKLVLEELGPVLGRISLSALGLFLNAWSPEISTALKASPARRYGGSTQIVGNDVGAYRAGLVTKFALILQGYTGAVPVDAVRRQIEDETGECVTTEWLLSVLRQQASYVFLGGGDRWCWISDRAATPMAETLAIMITLARASVGAESLYAGLIREIKRGRARTSVAYADHLPPFEIFSEILPQHPWFRRSSANSYFLTDAAVVRPQKGTRAGILARMEAAGGVTNLQDLVGKLDCEGKRMNEHSVRLQLYLAAWVERLSESVYGIRGRDISLGAIASARGRGLAGVASD